MIHRFPRAVLSSLPLLLAFFFLTAGHLEAQPNCAGFCNPLVPCNATCSTNIYTNCLAYNGVCNHDPDGDGVDLAYDNCPSTSNSNQADCDGDGIGDACDSLNGTFVPSGKKIACESDKDAHAGYTTYEMKYQQKYVDTSSCHSADRWNHSVLSNNCYGFCNDLDANACSGTCRNDASYSCASSLCSPVGQGTCIPDTIP